MEPISPNTTFSNYRILSQIGMGDSGMVWLAEDTRLARKVALKVLPKDFTQDADRLRRFQREARTASALNHPNIVTIYEIGQAEQGHFIVSEYIEGESLRARMSRGPLPLMAALEIALQIAAALEAAHRMGIVHRAVKPENVMIRPDGVTKLTNFGVAKLLEARPEDPDANATTTTAFLSGLTPASLIRTLSYVSPEQARSLKVDTRTDIFSFGAVLHELLSGQKAFPGETPTDVMIAVVEHEPPPLSELAPEAPLPLQGIVRKALRKEMTRRYQTIQQVAIELRAVKQDVEYNARLERSIVARPAPAATGPLGAPREGVDIAHVLFCDIVGYSIMPIERQTQMMRTLQEIVRQTEDYRQADAHGQLVRLPAGDGMALAFLQNVMAPVRCACEIQRALKAHPDMQLRIGIHSGAVFHSADINAIHNVVGSGINMAKRVMDCGDGGHILVSREVADVLAQISQWQPMLHDLGEHEVKHGTRLHLFNLYNAEVGNPALPAVLQKAPPPAAPKSPVITEPARKRMDTPPPPNAARGAAQPVRPAAARTTPPPPAAPVAPPAARSSRSWLLAAGLVIVLLFAGIVWWAFQPAAAPAVAAERAISYSLTVQKVRDGRPYQSEFQSSGSEVFESGWKFRLNLTSAQNGFLYLLNEQTDDSGESFALLFPPPSRREASAQFTADEVVRTDWYVFDNQPGTEHLRLVWSANPVPELERLRPAVSATTQGRLQDPALVKSLRAFLERQAATPVNKEPQSLQTLVRARGDILVALIELEHH